MLLETMTCADDTPFRFGRNWADFVRRHLDEERIEVARRHLLETLDRPGLRGLTFLDVGCGSGIHSLAAVRSGADRVVSVDIDPESVATTRQVRSWAGSPGHWEVLKALSSINLHFDRRLSASAAGASRARPA